MLKFFRTVEHDEYDTEKSLEKLKNYVNEQELKREMMYNN